MDFKNINSDLPFGYSFSSTPDSPYIPHHFHNYYELLLFEKGDAKYMVEGNIYNLKEGDILLTNPLEMHCPVFNSNTPYQRSIVFFKPSFLKEFLFESYDPFFALEKRKLGTQNKIDTALVKEYKLDEKINGIGYYYKNDLEESEIMQKTLLLQALVSINKIISFETKPKKNSNIENIIHIINDNLNQKITLDFLAEKTHLNKFHIAHVFKEKTGYSISNYIAHKRVFLVKELVKEGKTLQEAASEAGFSDYSSFYRSFTKIANDLPKNIKKTQSK